MIRTAPARAIARRERRRPRCGAMAAALLLMASVSTVARGATVTTRVTGAANWNTAATWIQNRTGTASFSNGSTAVTGTGTLFTTELQAGDVLLLQGTPATVRGTVASITDNTNLTLTAAATANASGAYGRQAVPGSSDDVNIGNTLLGTAVTVTLDVASTTVSTLTFVADNLANSLTHSGTNALTVSGNATLNQPTGGVTIAWNINGGSASVGGSLSLGGANTTTNRIAKIATTTGSLTVTGDLIYNSSASTAGTAVIDMSGGAGSMNLAGAMTLTNGTGTLTPGTSSTVVYNGTGAQAVGGGSAISYNSLTVNKSSGTATLGGSATLTGNLSVTAGTLDLSSYTLNRGSAGGTITVGANATLKIGGTNGFPSNYSTHTINSTSTVEYSGTTQTVSAESYGSLVVSGSGTKTAAGTLTAAGNLTVSGGTLDLSTYTADRTSAGGTLTVGAGATLKIGGTNGIPANYTTHTLNATSTVEYSGTTQTVSAEAYGNLVVSGSGTKTAAGTLTVAGNLTVSGGTLDLASYTANRTSSGGTLTVGAGATLKLGGTNGIPANYTTHTLNATSTVEYSGSTQTVAVESYGHLTISGTATKTLAGTISLAGDLTLSASTLSTSASNYNLTVAGNWTNNGGTFSGGSSTVTFTGSSKTIGGSASTAFPTLSITTGTVTLNTSGSCTALTLANDAVANSFTHGGTAALTVNGNATINQASGGAVVHAWNINAGSATVTGNLTLSVTANNAGRIARVVLTTGSLTVQGDLIYTNAQLAANGVVDMSGGACTLNLAGNFTVNTLGTLTPGTTSTVVYNGTGAQTVGGGSAISYNSLTINKSSGTATLGGSSTLSGNLSLSAGALDLSSFTLNRASAGGTITLGANTTLKIGGTNGFPANYSTHTINSTSTVEYSGTTQTVSAESYGSLVVSGSGTKTAAGATTIAGSLTVGSEATLDPGGALFTGSGTNTLTVSGTLQVDAATFAGNYTSFETLTLNAGSTVDYSGSIAQTVDQSLSYSNLGHSGTGTGTAGGNLTVAGDLTVSGGTLDLSTYTANRSSAGGVLTVGANATLKIGGSNGFPTNYTTNTLNASSTIQYAGTAPQTMAALSNYGRVKISNSSGVTLSGSATLSGVLTIDASALLSVTTGTLTSTNTITVDGTLTQSGGSISLGTTDKLDVGAGGIVNQSAGTFTLKDIAINASGTYNQSGGTLKVNHDWKNSGTFSATAGTVQFTGSGGGAAWPSAVLNQLYHVTIDAGVDPGFDNSAAVTIKVKGDWTNNGAPVLTATATTVEFNGSVAQSIGGSSSTPFNNLTVANTGATVTINTNCSAAANLTVNASAVLRPVASVVVSGAGTLTGNGTVQVTRATGSGDFEGQYTIASKTLTNLTVEFTGAAAQGVNANTFGGLKINNASGVTLGGDVTVNGTLTLASGNVTTGSNKVIISSTGSVSRTSGHVVGSLQKNVATGAPSRTFEIGDATSYTPVSLSFTGVTTAGDLTAGTTSGDHPNIGTSALNASKTVNRYWTMANSGTVFASYDATFTFVPGDVDAGANTSAFVVRRYASGAWSGTTVGTRTSTSTEITGATAFGDFQIGECNLSVSVSNGVFAFGTRPLNTWLAAQSSLLTNDGCSTETLAGRISTLTSGSYTWTLSNSSNGADQVRVQWSTTSDTGPWNDVAAYNQDFTITTDLASAGSVTIWFRLLTPTSTSSFNQYASTFTVTAQ